MHIHILGICGTFMGSLAILAKQLGHRVTGSDQAVYPPMSTQLEQQGIELIEGYDPSQLSPAPDLVVIGNAMSRGNPVVEAVLNQGLPYVSGPQWLAEHVLQGRWTLAVSGTHGKTTTSTMLAWILEYAGMAPGFLIGGVPKNFDASARLGETPFFVVEADEYDSAFFDKRSKFVHYRPRTLIVNNLEFDHADIFADVAAIQTQFHHLIRTVPGDGLVIAPKQVKTVDQMLAKGCWTPVQFVTPDSDDATLTDWKYRLLKEDGSQFEVEHQGTKQVVAWEMTGLHNVQNAVVAIAAAHHVGVLEAHAAQALCAFSGVKRRMEQVGRVGKIVVYDDFAHHPTAIETTLDGLRKKVGQEKIIALIEPRSNTMKMGVHQAALLESAAQADAIIWCNLGSLDWLDQLLTAPPVNHQLAKGIDRVLLQTLDWIGAQGDVPVHVVCMSNGGFGGVHAKLLTRLHDEVSV